MRGWLAGVTVIVLAAVAIAASHTVDLRVERAENLAAHARADCDHACELLFEITLAQQTQERQIEDLQRQVQRLQAPSGSPAPAGDAASSSDAAATP